MHYIYIILCVHIMTSAPFLYVVQVKTLMHNSAAAAAASLGGAAAAAHTALFATAMLCFTFGDVGSTMAQVDILNICYIMCIPFWRRRLNGGAGVPPRLCRERRRRRR